MSGSCQGSVVQKADGSSTIQDRNKTDGKLIPGKDRSEQITNMGGGGVPHPKRFPDGFYCVPSPSLWTLSRTLLCSRSSYLNLPRFCPKVLSLGMSFLMACVIVLPSPMIPLLRLIPNLVDPQTTCPGLTPS